MSGGRFNYQNDYLCSEIFGTSADYGEPGFEEGKFARKQNPLLDKQISELVWDVFVLLHSYDWAASGDTSDEDYFEDVAFFKKKWFGKTPEELALDEIGKQIEETKEELYRALGLEREGKS